MAFRKTAIAKSYCYAFTFILFLEVFAFSCTRQNKSSGEMTPVADNQTFVLTASTSKDNFDKLKQTVQNDLLPILVANKNIKSLKTFDSPSSDESHWFFAIIEMKHAKQSGIMVNSEGKVVKIDYSQFISPDFRNTGSFKNILSLKDLVKDYDLKICTLNETVMINREVSGFVKAK